MPEITIRFRYNPNTGKRQLVVKYESDEDALPHEHERDHRALVEDLIGRPLGDDEEVLIERGAGAPAGADDAATAPIAGRQAGKHGAGH